MKNTGRALGMALILKHKLTFFVAFFFVFTVTYGFLAVIDFLPETPAEEKAEVDLDESQVGQDVDNAEIPTISQAVDNGDDVDEDVFSEEAKEEMDSFSTIDNNIGDFNVNSSAAANEGNIETEPMATETVTQNSEPQVSQPTPTLPPDLSLGVGLVYPERMTINSLGRNLPVLNPTSRNINDLDEALLKGVVRHPDSAKLNQNGTVFILGHSSYLPNVINRNFQAFNGIQKLEWGDTISLFADGVEYVYRVDKVYEAPASEVVVPIAGPIPRLTLATCDSFGSKDDRFIVEATQIEVKEMLNEA